MPSIVASPVIVKSPTLVHVGAIRPEPTSVIFASPIFFTNRPCTENFTGFVSSSWSNEIVPARSSNDDATFETSTSTFTFLASTEP